jgi:hypothetical protein
VLRAVLGFGAPVVTLEDLADELRSQRDEIRALRRAVERLAPPPLTADQQRLLDALAATHDGPFTSAEVIDRAHALPCSRRELVDALQALGITEPRGLGIALSQIARRTALLDVRLVPAGLEAKSRVWVVERGT